MNKIYNPYTLQLLRAGALASTIGVFGLASPVGAFTINGGNVVITNSNDFWIEQSFNHTGGLIPGCDANVSCTNFSGVALGPIQLTLYGTVVTMCLCRRGTNNFSPPDGINCPALATPNMICQRRFTLESVAGSNPFWSNIGCRNGFVGANSGMICGTGSAEMGHCPGQGGSANRPECHRRTIVPAAHMHVRITCQAFNCSCNQGNYSQGGACHQCPPLYNVGGGRPSNEPQTGRSQCRIPANTDIHGSIGTFHFTGGPCFWYSG